MTRVAIVLPTKDRPRELSRAVRSVLAQTHTEWELHVVDDGSAVPVVLETDDPRVSLHRHEQSLGVSAARNAALGASGGQWVALLDDDDLWAPEKLERQLDVAAAHGAGLVWTATVLIDADGRVLRANPVAALPDPGVLRRYNVIGEPSSVLVSRAVVEEVGGFSPDLSIVADWDLWLRVAPRVRCFALDEPLTAIVEHAGSMQIVDVAGIERELAVLAARYGVDPAGAEMAYWMAGKRFAQQRSARTAVAYLRAAARAHGTPGAVRRIVRRGRARQGAAPEWVAQLVRG